MNRRPDSSRPFPHRPQPATPIPARAATLALAFAGILAFLPGPTAGGAEARPPADFALAGDWTVVVRVPAAPGHPAAEATLAVPPPEAVTIRNERHDSLPMFNPNTGGWVRGAQLRGVRAQETTTPFLLDPTSLEVRLSPEPDAPPLVRGRDYEADLDWGTVGRKEGGNLGEGQPVYASYRYTPLRLHAVVRDAAGHIVLRPGEPRSAAPEVPALAPGDRHLGNLWIPGRVPRLAASHLFPILESAYPEPPRPVPSIAESRLPRTFAKLRSGAPVRILAWGDSVTDGGYVPDPARNRWQEQFAGRLRAAYPKAQIELVTEAWGGRNTGSYLAEPPGSPHNYREKVLAAKPDLVVSEFVNDAGLNPDQVEQVYGRFLADFRELGAEWIILTPHYVRPDWMGLDRERDIDDDPRPYVAGLRRFAERHTDGLALADAARRYGRLWRQGIPYTALMLNSINHPDARGMAIFADALMELFPR
jgi:hypothetical protein